MITVSSAVRLNHGNESDDSERKLPDVKGDVAIG